SPQPPPLPLQHPTDREHGFMKLPDVISSRRPKRIKNAAKLLKRRDRKATGQFLVEGPQAVREALARKSSVVELCITDEAAEEHPSFVSIAMNGRMQCSIDTPEVDTELQFQVSS